MTKKLTIEEQTHQINTYTIRAKEFVRSKIPLDDVILPEPYLIIRDDHPLDNLAKAVNILTVKRGYRIVSFSTSHFSGYFVLEKQ
jgi:hypothetical protein